MIPAASIMSVFFVMPLLVFFRFSFNIHVPGKFMETGWTLENFTSFFTNEYYLGILWRTLYTAFFATLLTLLISLPLAFFMSKASGRVKSVMLILLVFPLMIGGVIRSTGWIGLFGEMGLLNRVLQEIGFISEPLKLMYNEVSVIVVIATIEAPLMTITIEGVLESISADVPNAALNLGASRFRVFKEITLPLAMPGILAGTSLVFVQCMNTYTTSRLIGGPTKPMMAPSLYMVLTEGNNWPFAAVMAVVMLVLTLGITYVYSSVLEKRYIKTLHLA